MANMAALVAWPDGKENLSTEVTEPTMSSWLCAGRALRNASFNTVITTTSITKPEKKVL